jgi:hypothetical protein
MHRQLGRLLAFGLIILGVAGCGKQTVQQTEVRPGDAMLTLGQVQRAEASGIVQGADLATLGSLEACGSLPDALKQVADASGGAVHFDGGGVLTLPAQVWTNAPGELREALAQTLQLSLACEKKSSARDLVLTVRDPNGKVLAKGTLQSIVG